jgi:hypothetical protein
MEHLDQRVTTLERQLRRQRYTSLAILALVAFALSLPSLEAQQPADTLRTRRLIVEDESGRPRITLGAPLTGIGTARTGLRISDTKGFERLGMNLFDDGRMVVGIDGPPPTSGPVGNLERINLVADADGTSYIVFKDRRTSVVARLYVDASDRPFLEFSDYTKDPAVRRRIGLASEDSPR